MLLLKKDFVEMTRYIAAHDVPPPLYYYIAKIFTMILGHSVPVVKLASIVPVILTMVLVACKAKKLFGQMGQIVDGAIAYISLDGGGPVEQHTHEHDHLFIVTEGEAKILLDNENVIVKKNESFLVKGKIPHSVWNNSDGETVMIGITVQ